MVCTRCTTSWRSCSWCPPCSLDTPGAFPSCRRVVAHSCCSSSRRSSGRFQSRTRWSSPLWAWSSPWLSVAPSCSSRTTQTFSRPGSSSELVHEQHRALVTATTSAFYLSSYLHHYFVKLLLLCLYSERKGKENNQDLHCQ